MHFLLAVSQFGYLVSPTAPPVPVLLNAYRAAIACSQKIQRWSFLQSMRLGAVQHRRYRPQWQEILVQLQWTLSPKLHSDEGTGQNGE